jgi:hypothetical protein
MPTDYLTDQFDNLGSVSTALPPSRLAQSMAPDPNANGADLLDQTQIQSGIESHQQKLPGRISIPSPTKADKIKQRWQHVKERSLPGPCRFQPRRMPALVCRPCTPGRLPPAIRPWNRPPTMSTPTGDALHFKVSSSVPSRKHILVYLYHSLILGVFSFNLQNFTSSSSLTQ